MKKRRITGFTTFMLALATLGSYLLFYLRWRKYMSTHIKVASTLAMTALGPIEYQMQGKGPAVLISHGSPGGYDSGLALAKLLNNTGYTTIAISRPGYLRTPLSSGRSPEEQADLFKALLDTLGIERTIIVGISGGAPAPLQFALRHPDRCLGLVIISGVTKYYSEEELLRALAFPQNWLKRLYYRILQLDKILLLLLPFALLLPTTSGSVELLNSSRHYELRKTGNANDMAEFEKISGYPLEKIQAPIFIFHSTDDNEVPFEHAQYLAEHAPHTQLLAVSKGNHTAFFRHAKSVRPKIHAFMDALQAENA